MKLLLLFLMASTSGYSQYVAVNTIDEFTGDRKIQVNCMTGNHWGESDKVTKGLFNHVYLTAQYIQSKNSDIGIKFFTLNIKNQTSGTCLSKENGKSIFLFEDKSTLECKQISETTCKSADLLANYAIDSEELSILITKKLQKIRIYTTDGYVDYEIKPEKIEALQQTFLVLKQTIAK